MLLYIHAFHLSNDKKTLLEKSLVTVGEGVTSRESLRRDSEQCTFLDLIWKTSVLPEWQIFCLLNSFEKKKK